MTNQDILELYEALARIEANNEQKFNIHVAYAMARNKAILENQALTIYRLRQQIFENYGEIKDDGSIFIQMKQLKMSIMKLMNYQTLKLI